MEVDMGCSSYLDKRREMLWELMVQLTSNEGVVTEEYMALFEDIRYVLRRECTVIPNSTAAFVGYGSTPYAGTRDGEFGRWHIDTQSGAYMLSLPILTALFNVPTSTDGVAMVAAIALPPMLDDVFQENHLQLMIEPTACGTEDGNRMDKVSQASTRLAVTVLCRLPSVALPEASDDRFQLTINRGVEGGVLAADLQPGTDVVLGHDLPFSPTEIWDFKIEWNVAEETRHQETPMRPMGTRVR